jgi:hypothetical protein
MTPENTTPSEEKEYKWARERAEAVQGLYIHILVYLVVNACLFGINWLSRGDNGGWWFYWATLGWGIGLAIHILVVATPVFSSEWVDRRADRLVARRRN